MKLGIQDVGVIDYMYRHYDKDYNGEYSYCEFFKLMYIVGAIHREFISADQNKDHTLSMQEFRSVLNHMEIQLEDLSARRIMDIFDINNDKVLSYGEFFLLYIFLKELKKAYSRFKKAKAITPNRLCRLLDSIEKEDIAAKELNKIFGDKLYAFELTMDSFARVIAPYKEKIQPLKTRSKVIVARHVHPPPADLDLVADGPWKDSSELNLVPPDVQDQIVWRRSCEIHPESALFVDGIDASDVIQGGLTNCWFLGALAVIAASSPNRIRSLFVAEDRERGLVRCKFYKRGKWVKVDVDDRLPCFKPEYKSKESHIADTVLYYASCLNKSEFWVPILEKAYAKLHGTYTALEFGDISEALKDLTGGATQTFIIKSDKNKREKQWRLILSLFKEQCLMGCAIDVGPDCSPHHSADIKAKGLLDNHAYSILKCLEVDGVRFLLLRNPWGKQEWNGDWADTSEKWDDIWKAKDFVTGGENKEDAYRFQDDGKFYMCFEDFVEYFNRLYILNQQLGEPKHILHGKWDASKAHGCHNHPLWYCNPRYVIKTSEPDTTVLVNLTQYDLRHRHSLNLEQVRTKGNYNAIGMYLFDKTNEDYKTMHVPNAIPKSTDFTDTRDTSIQFESKKAGTFVLLPCTFEPHKHISYTIEVFSNKHVTVAEIPTGKSHTMQGRWEKGFVPMADSFDAHRRVTKRNPTYLLKCSRDSNVDMILVPKEQMDLGFRIYTRAESGQFKCIHKEKFYGRSMCVSRTFLKSTDYIIEPITRIPKEFDTDFELVVFSDFISHFSKYVTQEDDV
eukprot:Phypoly_transcript_03152.p1 GENE.Phypoly_transcript_03152~~Phypoly_transcript_03152.p1  ORF type:complete len:806 (+),score=95.47 Phypoly_transcript_03152:50-2419(+)